MSDIIAKLQSGGLRGERRWNHSRLVLIGSWLMVYSWAEWSVTPCQQSAWKCVGGIHLEIIHPVLKSKVRHHTFLFVCGRLSLINYLKNLCCFPENSVQPSVHGRPGFSAVLKVMSHCTATCLDGFVNNVGMCHSAGLARKCFPLHPHKVPL